jgi:hypothetical protein
VRAANGSVGFASQVAPRREPLLLLAAAICACALSLFMFPSSSLAAKQVATVVGGSSEHAPERFANSGGPAVNETGAGGVAPGTFYVTDQNLVHNLAWVQQFAPDGRFVRGWGYDVIDAENHPGAPNDNGTGFEICDTTAGNTVEHCQIGVSGSAAGQLNRAADLAVDQATGNVYVSSPGASRTDVFAATGAFQGSFGYGVDTGAAALEFCTTASGCETGLSGSDGGQIGRAGAFSIVVAPPDAPNAGAVVIGENNNRRVQEFEPEHDGSDAVVGAEFVRAFGWDVLPGGGTGLEVCTSAAPGACRAGQTDAGGANPGQLASAEDIAVDDGGNVYVVDASNERVVKYAPSGLAAVDFAPAQLSIDPASTFDVPRTLTIAWDQVKNHLFAARAMSPAEAPPGGNFRIFELEPSGALVDTHMTDANADDQYYGPQIDGLAVDGIGDRIYAKGNATRRDDDRNYNVVFILDDVGQLPASLEVGEATEIGAHQATLPGEVNANGGVADWTLEIAKVGDDSWTTVATGEATGSDPSPIEVVAQDLEANASYRFRFRVAKSFGGPKSTSPERTFETPVVAPEVSTEAARQVSPTSALLVGAVNPNNLPTTYSFQYGLTDAYGQVVPDPDAALAATGRPVEVGARIAGLEPGATYHFRICASNSVGGACGADRTFVARAAGEEAGARVYEMVTPRLKNDRRTGNNRQYLEMLANPGIPTPDGESMLFNMRLGVLDPEAGIGFPFTADVAVISRGADAWHADSIHDVVPAMTGGSGLNTPIAVSRDFRVQAWHHNTRLFSPNGSPFSTVVRGDTGGLQGKGWYEWAPDVEELPYFKLSTDQALIDDDGERMLRWGNGAGAYRGLLGPEDPSRQQFEGTAGGDTVYLQEPPGTGAIELVNECSGQGAEATLIPLRDQNGTPLSGPTFNQGADDRIAAQPCVGGSVTSRHGANIALIENRKITAMAEDGSSVFFLSPDPSASPNSCTVLTHDESTVAAGAETRCPSQLYIRRRVGGKTVVRWISRPQVPDQAIGLLGPAVFEGASRDGRVVYFRTTSPLTADDPNATGGSGPITNGAASDKSWDLYRYELPEDPGADPGDGTLTRVSGGPGGDADPNVSFNGGRGAGLRFLSDNGRRAYFVTAAAIPGADSAAPIGGATEAGGTPTNATARNLYMYDADQSGADRWRFVAQLPWAPNNAEQIDRCAVSGAISGFAMDNTFGQEPRRAVNVNCVRGTPGGHSIVFESAGRLTEDDRDDAGDIYLFDAAADELTRLSAPPAGTEAPVCSHGTQGPNERCNADLGFKPARFEVLMTDAIGFGGFRQANLAMDADGRLKAVYFESYLQLVPEDSNQRMDVYEWRNGGLSLISPGNSDNHAYFSGNSRDGQDVFFQTLQRLSPWEVEDADLDIYDARVGGGLPGPPQVSRCDVQAGGCDGRADGPPAAVNPASGIVRDAGNVAPKDRKSRRGQKCRQKQTSGKSGKRPAAKGCRGKRAGRGKCKPRGAKKGKAKRSNAKKQRPAKRCGGASRGANGKGRAGR